MDRRWRGEDGLQAEAFNRIFETKYFFATSTVLLRGIAAESIMLS